MVTKKTFFCFDLEQIRDHFYYTNGGYLYSKSGLRFAVTQSIVLCPLPGQYRIELFILKIAFLDYMRESIGQNGSKRRKLPKRSPRVEIFEISLTRKNFC